MMKNEKKENKGKRKEKAAKELDYLLGWANGEITLTEMREKLEEGST